VVYLCDCSGSMVSKFDQLRQEIHRSVRALEPDQSFNIVFFVSTPFALSRDGLVQANELNFEKARQFLDKQEAYPTDPIPSLDLVFKFKPTPEVFYLLTDGDFPDNQQVIDCLRTHNPRGPGRIRVNTIAYIDHGETYEKVLAQIAAENGGVYKFVSDEELLQGVGHN
jgi:hypothetical protein